jgi:hypothetical protein
VMQVCRTTVNSQFAVSRVCTLVGFVRLVRRILPRWHSLHRSNIPSSLVYRERFVVIFDTNRFRSPLSRFPFRSLHRSKSIPILDEDAGRSASAASAHGDATDGTSTATIPFATTTAISFATANATTISFGAAATNNDATTANWPKRYCWIRRR